MTSCTPSKRSTRLSHGPSLRLRSKGSYQGRGFSVNAAHRADRARSSIGLIVPRTPGCRGSLPMIGGHSTEWRSPHRDRWSRIRPTPWTASRETAKESFSRPRLLEWPHGGRSAVRVQFQHLQRDHCHQQDAGKDGQNSLYLIGQQRSHPPECWSASNRPGYPQWRGRA